MCLGPKYNDEGITSESIEDKHYGKLAVGDHLAVKDTCLNEGYFHHGILTSTGPNPRVIDFNGTTKANAELRDVLLMDFINNRKPLYRVNHRNRYSGEETAKQAHLVKNSRTWGKYNVLQNNCEHFAFYCVTGKKSSEQVSKLVNECLHIAEMQIPKLLWT